MKFATILAAALALATGAPSSAIAQTPQVGDVVAGPVASGTVFRLITQKGSVAFAVPNDWGVIAMQSRPPVAAVGFQAPNPADRGTPDSTDVAVSIFHPDTDQARSARAKIGQAFGPTPPALSQYKGWTVYTQQAPQGPTAYTIVDAVRDLPDINAAVAVRLAWPHLKNNAAGYDAEMNGAFRKLLDSVASAPGPYSPGPREVVRRPTP